MKLIKKSQLHYVAALVPYQHQKLIDEVMTDFEKSSADEKQAEMQNYRAKKVIWGEERTVLIYISEKLKAGRIRGIYQSLEKIQHSLKELQNTLDNPRAKRKDREKLEQKIKKIIKGQFLAEILVWKLEEYSSRKFKLSFSIDDNKLSEIENHLEFRILMTDRHDWDSKDIIKAYHEQSQVEQVFKNVKNPYRLTMKPQFHWTDQKIRVHFFICVLGYLLATLAWREIKNKCHFKGTLNSFLNEINNV